MLVSSQLFDQNSDKSSRIRVMQVVDSLDAGGAETVALNIANSLPVDRFASYLCATRRTGPLKARLASHVPLICLERKGRFDLNALRRMSQYIAAQGIQVLHAHGSSLFIAQLASLGLGRRGPAIVWHDHYGRCEDDGRSCWLYRTATRGAGVIAVNTRLARWSREKLHVPTDRVWYVPNWIEKPLFAGGAPLTLPGQPGKRIALVANFRAQKDHVTLLRALVQVRESVPDVHLLVVGAPSEPGYAEHVHQQIRSLKLEKNVEILGYRQDVNAILSECDIGVLSSVSEGLPLALLEYGGASLPVVATDVGQCREVLENGQAGILVPPSSPDEMARALVGLLASQDRRAQLGAALHECVRSKHDPQVIIRQICQIYTSLLRTELSDSI